MLTAFLTIFFSLLLWTAGTIGWSYPADPAIDAILPTAQAVFAADRVAWTDAAGRPLSGFRPASRYPPLYARDMSWIAPAVRYLYPLADRQSAVEAFLRRQYTAQTRSDEDGWQAGAGALPGVLHADAAIDKASATSDEETSVIDTAYSVFQDLGPAWLVTRLESSALQVAPQPRVLNGATQGIPAASLVSPRVIDRLDAALAWLWRERLDPASGLIWRGHTTDWGDVTLDRSAPNPSDIDPARAIRTASIYDQVLAWRSAQQVAALWDAVGNPSAAAAWRAHAAALRVVTNRLLWQPQRGFFKLHLHLTGANGSPPWQHNFDENRILAIGNAVAVQAGFSNPDQSRSIVSALARAQVAAGLAQPGLSLWPPYGSWTYPDADMQRGWYQNGGVWDWWAGVQVQAEFEAGYTQRALLHLRQLAHAWQRHPGKVYEWQLLERPVGAGADDYAAAAATVMQAVVKGLYGVDWREGGRLALTVRLADQPGSLALAVPDTGRAVSYTYSVKAAALRLDYLVQGAGDFPLRLRLPPGRSAAVLLLDDRPFAFIIERTGDDRFVALTAPPGSHTVRVVTARG